MIGEPELNPAQREVVELLGAPESERPRFDAGLRHELRAELERLKAENEALRNKRSGAVSMKVSEKGGLSVYGLGRFPVTLYQEQWTRLLDMADEIRAFIREHQGQLKKRD